MALYTLTVAAFYNNIKIEADDEEEAKQIAIMTIQDRWHDDVVAVVDEVEHGNE